MGSRSRRSRSTGRGGSNWKRAALARSSKEKEKEEFVQRPCRFSHSTKIPEVRLLLSLSLSLSPPCIYRAARAKFELLPRSFAKRKKLDRFLFCRSSARASEQPSSSRARPPSVLRIHPPAVPNSGRSACSIRLSFSTFRGSSIDNEIFLLEPPLRSRNILRAD